VGAILCHCGGCKSPDQTAALLDTLQQGHATGNLTLTSDGRLAVGMEQAFSLGANKSAVAFDGHIDFGASATDVMVWPDQEAKQAKQKAKAEEAEKPPGGE